MRDGTSAVDDFRKMADGLGVEAGFRGGDCGGFATEEEFDVA